MTVRKYSSRSQQTTLASSLSAGSGTMIVVSGANLMGGRTPTVNETYTVVIDPDTALEEIVDISNYSSGNTLTITRGVDGSSDVSHSAGAVIRHMAIGRDYRESNDHINNTTSAHGLTIANVVSTTDTSKVSSGMLIDGAVGTAKIDNTAVTEAKLAPNAVSTAKIVDSAVTSNKIADNAITTGKIADGTIVNADINSSAQVAYSKLNLTNGIVNADINASAGIALSKLASNPLDRSVHTGTQLASTISDFDTQVRTSKLNQMAAPTAAVDVNSQKITSLATPTTGTDAANKTYVDTQINNLIDGAPATLDTLNEIAAALADTANFSDTVVLKTGSTMSGNLAMGNNKITGLADAVNLTDAVNLNTVNNLALAPSNLTGPITSIGNVTSIASQTGTGTKFVVDTSPTLVTPNIGVATATSINGTIIPTSKTLVATDSTQYVVPSQTGNAGKYLTTNGTTSSWQTVTVDPTPSIFMLMGA